MAQNQQFWEKKSEVNSNMFLYFLTLSPSNSIDINIKRSPHEKCNETKENFIFNSRCKIFMCAAFGLEIRWSSLQLTQKRDWCCCSLGHIFAFLMNIELLIKLIAFPLLSNITRKSSTLIQKSKQFKNHRRKKNPSSSSFRSRLKTKQKTFHPAFSKHQQRSDSCFVYS